MLWFPKCFPLCVLLRWHPTALSVLCTGEEGEAQRREWPVVAPTSVCVGLECELSLPSLALCPSCSPPFHLSSSSLSKRNASGSCRHGQHDFISCLHALVSHCCMTSRHKPSSLQLSIGQKSRCRAAGFPAQCQEAQSVWGMTWAEF